MTTKTKKRGRPAKVAPDKREAASTPAVAKSDEYKPVPLPSHIPTMTEQLADSIAVAVTDKLMLYLPIVARLASADTVHSMEKPETVLKRAISEGRLAAAILAAQNQEV